jgi:hypothetical protein
MRYLEFTLFLAVCFAIAPLVEASLIIAGYL